MFIFAVHCAECDSLDVIHLMWKERCIVSEIYGLVSDGLSDCGEFVELPESGESMT